MKTILKAATAAIAIFGMSGTAFADTSTQTTYSGIGGATPVTFNGNSLGSAITGALWNAAQSAGGNVQALSGSRYRQSRTVTNQNTETAQESVSNSFTLTGSVTKDCSFYGGGQTGHSINLGTIGVRTGNNDNVSIAFNQRDAITANVNSATAGCNTNNSVTIAKTNGAAGLRNFAPGAFDSNQFTDRIPYSVEATWTGVALGSRAGGTAQTLTVAATQGTQRKNGGAWRSTFDMNVNAPAANKGLVAGEYTDTITVTLAAI